MLGDNGYTGHTNCFGTPQLMEITSVRLNEPHTLGNATRDYTSYFDRLNQGDVSGWTDLINLMEEAINQLL